jgi:hypothetical protein
MPKAWLTWRYEFVTPPVSPTHTFTSWLHNDGATLLWGALHPGHTACLCVLLSPSSPGDDVVALHFCSPGGRPVAHPCSRHVAAFRCSELLYTLRRVRIWYIAPIPVRTCGSAHLLHALQIVPAVPHGGNGRCWPGPTARSLTTEMPTPLRRRSRPSGRDVDALGSNRVFSSESIVRRGDHWPIRESDNGDPIYGINRR